MVSWAMAYGQHILLGFVLAAIPFIEKPLCFFPQGDGGTFLWPEPAAPASLGRGSLEAEQRRCVSGGKGML